MKARGRPLLADSFQLPAATHVDARLVGGAALFGVGWGLAGYCPGPALVSLVHPTPSTVAFLAAMTAGLLLASRVDASPAKNVTCAGGTSPQAGTIGLG
jgi:uncharacterized membrane protein YedE/YeeE